MEFNVRYCLDLSDKKISPPQILNAFSRVVMNRTSEIRVKCVGFEAYGLQFLMLEKY